jgi:hypothetical protein
MNDRRDECAPFSLRGTYTLILMILYSGRQYAETISALHGTGQQLSIRPETVPVYMLRMYTLSLRRSAILAQLDVEENHALECVEIAYEEERKRVEEGWEREVEIGFVSG